MYIFSIGKLSDGTDAAKCTYSVAVNSLMIKMRKNAHNYSVSVNSLMVPMRQNSHNYSVSVNFLMVPMRPNSHTQYR